MATDTNPGADVDPDRTGRPSLSATLAEIRQAGQPIVLTVNRTDLAVEDEGSYQRFIELIDRLETVRRIRDALRDVEEGRTMSLEEFRGEVQKRHGIPG